MILERAFLALSLPVWLVSSLFFSVCMRVRDEAHRDLLFFRSSFLFFRSVNMLQGYTSE